MLTEPIVLDEPRTFLEMKEQDMTPNKEFCHALKQRIASAYKTSGNMCGWRLLASPASVLDGADVAFIGLNPGGSHQPEDHGEFAMVQGSAYVVETWGSASRGSGNSPLQRQVRALFKGLSVEPEKVLSGNLVPFRSPDWQSLQRPDFSLRFGETLWADILHRANPSLVIGMGGAVLKPLSRILGAKNIRSIPVGWGNCTAKIATTRGGSLVVLPHLSRFGIVTRQESADALSALFGERWRP